MCHRLGKLIRYSYAFLHNFVRGSSSLNDMLAELQFMSTVFWAYRYDTGVSNDS